MREWLRPIATYTLFGLIAICIFGHALATQRETRRLLRDCRRLRLQNARIHQDNARRERILRALATDPFYVERVLRERYGYVRAGEERRRSPRSASAPLRQHNQPL